MVSPTSDFLSLDNLKKLRVSKPYQPGPSIPVNVTSADTRQRHRSGQYVKGPIYLGWLGPALNLRGKAPLAVALAIQFKAGCEPDAPFIVVSNSLAEKFGVNPKAKRAALKELEGAGLIRVTRYLKRAPRVTIILSSDEVRYLHPTLAKPGNDPCQN